ncbi:MAG: DoxX family protein [Candidatus Sulfotelmatobacter sp.]
MLAIGTLARHQFPGAAQIASTRTGKLAVRIRVGFEFLMVVLIVLLVSWLILRAIGTAGVQALASWQNSALYALAVMFVFTATAHFNRMKHDLAQMIPSYFPRPLLIVYITGVLELLGATGLVLPEFRRLAGVCLIALLIGMFVANVNAAQKSLTLGGKPATPLWLRTPMQALFIALLWWSTRA